MGSEATLQGLKKRMRGQTVEAAGVHWLFQEFHHKW